MAEWRRAYHACSATANDDHLLPFIFSHWLGCHDKCLISRTAMWTRTERDEVNADEQESGSNGQRHNAREGKGRRYIPRACGKI